jgi:hypothetical protein
MGELLRNRQASSSLRGSISMMAGIDVVESICLVSVGECSTTGTNPQTNPRNVLERRRSHEEDSERAEETMARDADV